MARTRYDKMVVVDLEATCWKGKPPEGEQSEITEIGVATLDLKRGNIVVMPDMFVRPVESTISPFCTELTSITADMVADAPTLEEVLASLKSTFKDRVFGAWGEYDPNQINRETKRKGIKFRLPRTCVNLKSEFARYHGLSKETSVDGALKHLGLEFMPPPGVEEGTAHRGSHDAFNIARIIRKTMAGDYRQRFNPDLSDAKSIDEAVFRLVTEFGPLGPGDLVYLWLGADKSDMIKNMSGADAKRWAMKMAGDEYKGEYKLKWDDGCRVHAGR